MDTSASSYTTVGDSFSSPPFSPTATSSSSSPPVGESSSSPPVKLDAIKENTSVLTEWPRRGQRQRRQGRQDIPTGDMSPLGSVEGGQQPQERRPGQFTLPPPVGLGSVEGGQQPQERRPGRLTPPPQVSLRSVDDWQQPKEKRPSLQANIRSSKTKERMAPSLSQPVDHVGGRFYALVDLPGEEKSSSDLSDSSETDDDLSYDTNHVLAWRDPGLPTPVFVRMHSSGVFYTYPTLGDKPFQSLDEVQDAVISYACPNSNAMSDEILSETERIVRARLFWPNGTRKVCTRAQAAKREHDKIRRLVEALLDKRNDTEGRVDELKNIVHWQSIFEGVHKWYYHLNITVKTKGAADDASSTSLFFVEVERDCNDIVGYYINTFFRVNTDSQDGEATCHGCTNNGSRDMKHPAAGLPAGSFKGGHMDIRFPDGFGPCNEKQWLDSSNTESEDEELIKEEEKRIRDSYEDPDDAEFWENARNKRLHYRSWDHKINLQSDEEIADEDSDEE